MENARRYFRIEAAPNSVVKITCFCTDHSEDHDRMLVDYVRTRAKCGNTTIIVAHEDANIVRVFTCH